MMTKEEQRIAIAEACGWKVNPDKAIAHCFPEQMLDPKDGKIKVIPNYCESLDAMATATKTLTRLQRQTFCETLYAKYDWGSSIRTHVYYKIFCEPSADIQAECFCRTLWPERF